MKSVFSLPERSFPPVQAEQPSWLEEKNMMKRFVESWKCGRGVAFANRARRPHAQRTRPDIHKHGDERWRVSIVSAVCVLVFPLTQF